MGETMPSSDCPVQFPAPEEPLSLTEHAIRHLAGSDGFEELPVVSVEERSFSPLFGVEVRPHRYLITVRLPDFRHDEVAVAITGSEVLIYGRHTVADGDSNGPPSARSFSKTFRLPHWIDLGSSEAVFHDGVLEVGFSRTVQQGLRFVDVKLGTGHEGSSCVGCSVVTAK